MTRDRLRRRAVRSLVALFLWLGIMGAGGCAGFRGGTFSAPYIGDREPELTPPKTPYELAELQKLHLPGVTLEVALNNSKRAYDYTVMMFVVPTSVELGDAGMNAAARVFRIDLSIKPSVAGFEFDPRHAIVSVDGTVFEPTTGSTVAANETPRALDQVGNDYSFTLLYDTAAPSPEARISLDLSRALTHPGLPAIPVIKFKKMDWSAGYT